MPVRHLTALFSAAIAAPLLLTACGADQGDGGQQQPPPTVNVALLEPRDITEWDEFSGRIQAVNTVELRPRVNGYLHAMHFDEGAIVSAGDLLFSIDDQEYRAALAAASADVARATTRVELAKQELDRGEALREARALSAEELDQRRGEWRQARADLAAAEAARNRAALDVGFTEIRAPMDGRIGAALAKPGNLVRQGETLLATLVSIDPVHVVFEGDERIYLKYQSQAKTGDRPSSRDVANPVQVGLASDTNFPFRGRMDFVDNRINPATGTIQGRAVIDNPDGFLIPGLFARVKLLASNSHPALLISELAVLTDQDRKFVYVVSDDDKAVRRDIQLGRSIDGLRVVESGLSAGERIVVNGVAKIFYSGAPVDPVMVPMDDPTASGDTPAETDAS